MINKVILIGNAGADPEVRYTKSGQAVADLHIATNEVWKDKSGQRQERTEWHSVVLWGQQAEFAQNYIKKGRQVFVEGRLQTRDWTDQQNVKRYKTEVVANMVKLLGRPSDDQGSRSASGPPRDEDYGPPQGGSQGGPPDETYVEDDIPF